MSFKDQINKFVGKVRISDIENAFNFIIDNVNAFIDTINNGSEFLEDTDNFYLGSTSIPAGNYTLTLGALKKILTAYNKEVIGGTVVKNPLNTDKAILFPSLEISKDNGITQIMQTEIDKPSQADIQTNPEVGKVIGYDTENSVITNENNVISRTTQFEFTNAEDFENCVVDNEHVTISDDSFSYNRAISSSFQIYDGFYFGDYRVTSLNNYTEKTMNVSFALTRPKKNGSDVGENAGYITAHFDLFYNNTRATDGIRITYLNTNTGEYELYSDAKWKLTSNQDFIKVDNLNTSTETGVILSGGEFKIINNNPDGKIALIGFGISYQADDEPPYSEPGELSFSFSEIDKCYTYRYIAGGTTILPPGQTNPDIIKIADIDWNRDEWVMNTTDDWLYINPEQSPLISLTVQNPPRGSAVNPDNTKPQFIVPRRYGTYAGERGDNDGGLVRLANGSNIIDNNYTNWPKSRNRTIDFVFAPVWVPQGMASTIFPIYGCSIAQYYTLS